MRSASPAERDQTADWLEIGKIVSAQGLKGELRVYPSSDFPARFEQPGERWLLRPGAKEPEAVQLRKGRLLGGKGLYVIELEDIGDRDQAEALRGAILLVPASDRPPLEENEFHVSDLIDLEVFDQTTQTVIGTVISVIPAGNDLLEVKCVEPRVPEPESAAEVVAESSQRRARKPKKAKPKTVLIPFVEAIVPVVDLAQGRIEVVPPPGLLDV